jgi:4a-hydroxytetrahydrobiopterin dehydratase
MSLAYARGLYRTRLRVDNGRVSHLTDEEVDAALDALPSWRRAGDAIVREYRLPAFADAIAFVVRVGFLAEAADHHPDVDIRWRTVKVGLSTHSEGGITEKDLDLAALVEAAAERQAAE